MQKTELTTETTTEGIAPQEGVTLQPEEIGTATTTAMFVQQPTEMQISMQKTEVTTETNSRRHFCATE